MYNPRRYTLQDPAICCVSRDAPLMPLREVAGAAVFLASGDSPFMATADLVIDGGYTA